MRWKRTLPGALLMALLFLTMAWARAGAEGMVSFEGELPEALLPAFPAEDWAGYRVLAGQYGASTEGSAYAQVILEKDGQRVLCALNRWSEGWVLTAVGRRALYPDRLPTLRTSPSYPDGWCFDVIYDDPATGRSELWKFFSGTDTWRLQRYALQEGDRTLVEISSSDRALAVNGEQVFNVLPITLEALDAQAFPKTLEEARRLAQAAPEAQNGKGLVVSASDEEPAVLRAAPSLEAQALWHFYAGTEALLCGAPQDGWVRVRIGDQEGYLPRENLAIGQEKAAIWYGEGFPGVVYMPMPAHELSLYERPDKRSQTLQMLPQNASVKVLGISPDLTWLMARFQADEGQPWQTGYLEAKFVPKSGNMRSGRVYNPNPEDRLNLRTGPDRSYPSLGRYYNGQEVLFLFGTANEDAWRLVVIEGVVGYMDAQYLGFGSTSRTNDLPPLGRVGRDGLALRAEASEASAARAAYPAGTLVEILAVAGDWAHVRVLSDGLCGYMPLSEIGGEPARAASAWVTVLEDVTVADGWRGSSAEPVRLRAGDQVNISSRPYPRWTRPYDLETGTYGDLALVENDPWAQISGPRESQEFWGYVPWAALAWETP